jgi:hypothetical protein
LGKRLLSGKSAMTDPYTLAPKPPDSPDLMVRCVDGPHDGKLMKVRMLKNLSGGIYKRDPALTWSEKQIPCYRWVPAY